VQTLRDMAYHTALRTNDRAFRKNVKANRTTRLRELLDTSCSSKGSPGTRRKDGSYTGWVMENWRF